jgi:hypothetical protein
VPNFENTSTNASSIMVWTKQAILEICVWRNNNIRIMASKQDRNVFAICLAEAALSIGANDLAIKAVKGLDGQFAAHLRDDTASHFYKPGKTLDEVRKMTMRAFMPKPKAPLLAWLGFSSFSPK